jgi:sec-independent protein translocase protein TatB
MFDVGFSEIVLIAVVALVVVGPEKLPKLARTLGALVGRMRGYVATVKGEVEREMQLEDLKKLQQEIQSHQVPVTVSQPKTAKPKSVTARPVKTKSTKPQSKPPSKNVIPNE